MRDECPILPWWKEPIVWGFVISLLLHIFAPWRYMSLWRLDQISIPRELEPIEISDYVPKAPPQPSTERRAPPPKARPNQIAETEDAGNRELDPNAKYLSDRNQKALKETRTKNVDAFHSGGGTGAKGSPESEKKPEEQTAQNSQTEITDPDAWDNATTQSGPIKQKDWRHLSLKDLGMGGNGVDASASSDYLRGVDSNNRTVLSTREYKFFSYYQRIRELIRQRWSTMVRRKYEKIINKGKNPTEDEISTRLVILLDEKGALVKISRVGKSGYDELDDAAVEAFEYAAPFPNPPKGMVDADGMVRLSWEFVLTIEQTPRIQFRTVGSGGNAPYY